MRIDVSEMKTYRECKRKHQFSSRNRFHLRPIVNNANLIYGTQMHEALAMMYLGASLDDIIAWIDREVTDTIYNRIMTINMTGYYNGPYQQDLKDYVFLDVERGFNFPVACVSPDCKWPDDIIQESVRKIEDGTGWVGVDKDGCEQELLSVCGSIDMIVINVKEGTLDGFEHKSAKNFRPPIYDLVDEQPRMYSIALKQILKEYHAAGKYLEIQETGAIHLNQIRKLQTRFDWRRTPCKYAEQDLDRFMQRFIIDAKQIANETAADALPTPGFMKCQMCDYATLCMHYGYCDIEFNELKKEFDGEYEVREHDHLDEKAERTAEE